MTKKAKHQETESDEGRDIQRQDTATSIAHQQVGNIISRECHGQGRTDQIQAGIAPASFALACEQRKALRDGQGYLSTTIIVGCTVKLSNPLLLDMKPTFMDFPSTS